MRACANECCRRKMAAWRAKLATSNEDDMCSVCFSATKYSCLRCEIPICNKCSIFEQDEDHQGWVAGKRVAFCEPCAREVGKNVTNTENHVNSVVLKETKEQRMSVFPLKKGKLIFMVTCYLSSACQVAHRASTTARCGHGVPSVF